MVIGRPSVSARKVDGGAVRSWGLFDLLGGVQPLATEWLKQSNRTTVVCGGGDGRLVNAPGFAAVAGPKPPEWNNTDGLLLSLVHDMKIACRQIADRFAPARRQPPRSAGPSFTGWPW